MQKILENVEQLVSAIDFGQLSSLEDAELHRLWRVRFGRNVPTHLPRTLFQRLLHYRIQAKVSGDPHRSLRVTLNKVLAGGLSPSNASGLRPGSVLIREHGGELHRVMVLENGFAWSGIAACPRPPSLSPAPNGTVVDSSVWIGRLPRNDQAI
ncbi:DUF2924 domain-containing protein [Nordella sp. HKS 07]|nr:DUF2924 domain-containing protein [Nordella sp. HKS 07]QIG46783.1 DUF2924 domain-containing protein [Nordella sp. HKS 07]